MLFFSLALFFPPFIYPNLKIRLYKCISFFMVCLISENLKTKKIDICYLNKEVNMEEDEETKEEETEDDDDTEDDEDDEAEENED